MKNEATHTCTPNEVNPANPSCDPELSAGAIAAEFAEAHYDEVLRYCARRLPNREDAQDATQEVFLRLARSNALYERRGKPLAYLYACARNVCAEFYRRPSVSRESAEGWEERIADPACEHDETRLVMSDAIARLSADEQEVLELRYGQGLAMNEIAAATGRSRFAIRRVEKRALAALEAMIGDRP